MKVKHLQEFLAKFTEGEGSRQGNAVSDAVIMVEMVNLLPVNGYQFDFSLNLGFLDVVAAIDGN